jgi:hypothetical protein
MLVWHTASWTAHNMWCMSMKVKEIRHVDMDWTNVAQIRDHWWALVNTYWMLGSHNTWGNFWLTGYLLAFQERICSVDLVSLLVKTSQKPECVLYSYTFNLLQILIEATIKNWIINLYLQSIFWRYCIWRKELYINIQTNKVINVYYFTLV